MTCDKCSSKRIVKVWSKPSDQASVTLGHLTKDGYSIPKDLGIKGAGYIIFSYCLDCGKIQGDFPLKPSKMEY